MRIAIREQLALLILLASLVSLAVISVPTWVTNHDFVLGIRASLLSNVASLKAGQLASNLDLMQTSVAFVSTRVVIQEAVVQYNTDGTRSSAMWAAASSDMLSALRGTNSVGQQILLQSMLFPSSSNGTLARSSLLNTTSNVHGDYLLPYNCSEGTDKGRRAQLGMTYSECGDLGYPPPLYPNFTYTSGDTNEASVDGLTVGGTSALLLGPWPLNDTLWLVSVTVPMLNVNHTTSVIGWLTFVMKWDLIAQVIDSTQDLGSTGLSLLVGPASPTNVFPSDIFYKTDGPDPPKDFEVRYVVPVNDTDNTRHPNHTMRSANPPFRASSYPAIISAVAVNQGNQDNTGSSIRTHNEAGQAVAVGYAVPQTPLVDWVVIVEMAQSEVFRPINHLRNILLACIFGTLGVMALVSFPLAHFASRPIRRLREATEKSIAMPEPDVDVYRSSSDNSGGRLDGSPDDAASGDGHGSAAELARKEGFIGSVVAWRPGRKRERESRPDDARRRQFRVPGKVKEHKHLVKDELSDLTATFNEMTDELTTQYERLEERVKVRTAELELSKKAAEAANESKTLFIANISHELKTPLNGILGMCAVCMQEDDPLRVKRSLGIIYKSGDLLLNLLTDLLTFSKNQVGQQLSLDEKEFLLRDVSSQVLAIFETQARESKIDLRVDWEGIQNIAGDTSSPERGDYGPGSTGKMRNMVLYGDVQRILQVLINLVSNSLKFTPAGGSVVMTIRCLPDVASLESRKGSQTSRQSRPSRKSSARHKDSEASLASSRLETANSINPRDKPNGLRYSHTSDRNPSPPPGRVLAFEFEVQDTGPGIPEEIHDKIFEPFMQGDLGLSKKHAGTGLGLSICSQLASLMRGTIGVQSTVGAGSTFTMKIPLRHVKSRTHSSASSGIDDLFEGGSGIVSVSDDERAPPRRKTPTGEHATGSPEKMASPTKSKAAAEPRLVGLSQPFFAPPEPLESPGSQAAAMQKITADAQRSNRKVRVLVADDNKVNQEVVCRMLKLEDVYDVTVAKDGQEALDLVKESMTPSPQDEHPPKKPFDLIFMDVQMPNVDGLESTRLIRAHGYQAPIVALTAFAEESNVKDCYDSGMNYFLSKPIRRPQLKKVLRDYCPPIPEENEDLVQPSPPDPLSQAGAAMAVVPPVDAAAPPRPLAAGPSPAAAAGLLPPEVDLSPKSLPSEFIATSPPAKPSGSAEPPA